MANGQQAYHPTPTKPRHFSSAADHGTIIELSELRTERLRETESTSLRRRLARRFSIIASDSFKIIVNGTEVTPSDRSDLAVAQYVWIFSGTPRPKIPESATVLELDNRAEGWPQGMKVRGWIATVNKPRQLSTPEGNLNSIVVMSRGRLVDEDILPQVTSAEMSNRYITGQVEADFLDESAAEDIVTSDRQRLREDDPRVSQLLSFVQQRMRHVGTKWLALRGKDKSDALRDMYPAIDDWLTGLSHGWSKRAEQLLQRVATFEVERESDRATLAKHAILGFERLRLRGQEDELEQALQSGVDSLLRLLADRDALESSYYSDIVRNRLDVVRAFEDMIDHDKKERVLQEYLFDHLWLLDPAWERAAGSEAKEKKLRLRSPFSDDTETKEEYGRVDIRYRTAAGKHVIIELKRASVRPKIWDLAEQGAKYVDALKDILPHEERDKAAIEVVFVIGKSLDVEPDRVDSVMRAISPGSRVRTYDQLIVGARESYSEYLEKARDADRFENLLEQIDAPNEEDDTDE